MGYSFWTEKFSKNWIRCTFIQHNGQFIHKTCKYDASNLIKEGKKCSYLVDPDLIHYEGTVPYLMYFADNPVPITFIHTKNEFNGRVITSEIFNDFCESKVIQEVLRIGAPEALLLILLGVVIILQLANMGVGLGIFNHAANATMNATNATAPIIIH